MLTGQPRLWPQPSSLPGAAGRAAGSFSGSFSRASARPGASASRAQSIATSLPSQMPSPTMLQLLQPAGDVSPSAVGRTAAADVWQPFAGIVPHLESTQSISIVCIALPSPAPSVAGLAARLICQGVCWQAEKSWMHLGCRTGKLHEGRRGVIAFVSEDS